MSSASTDPYRLFAGLTFLRLRGVAHLEPYLFFADVQGVNTPIVLVSQSRSSGDGGVRGVDFLQRNFFWPTSNALTPTPSSFRRSPVPHRPGGRVPTAKFL